MAKSLCLLTVLATALIVNSARAGAQQATPTFGEDPMPSFGEVAMPAPKSAAQPQPQAQPQAQLPAPAPVPAASAPAAPAGGDAPGSAPFPPVPGADSSPAPTPPPAAAPPAQLSWGEQEVVNAGLRFTPTGWSGSYYAMVQGRLDKWDFYTDGTFLHEGVWNGVGAEGGTSQRGVYSLSGNSITLQFAPPVSAFSAGGGLGAGQGPAGPPQTVPFQMIGPKGTQGIVLGTEHLQVRDW